MKNPNRLLLSLLPALVLPVSCTTSAPPVVGGIPERATIVHTTSGRLFLNDKQIPGIGVSRINGRTSVVSQENLLLKELADLHKNTGFGKLGYLREAGSNASLSIPLAARIARFCLANNISLDATETFEDRRGYGLLTGQLTH